MNINVISNDFITEKNCTENLSCLTHNSSLEENISTDLYVENYSLVIKICFATFGFLAILINIVASSALTNTKKTPFAAKFLAKALLKFDMCFILFSTVRKFILDPAINTSLMVAGTLNLQMSFVTIGLMSIERYLVFSWPNKYLRYCTVRLVRVCSLTVWLTCACTFFILRYGICYLQNMSVALVFVKAGTCNMIVTVYYFALVFFVFGASFTCYYKIIQIIKRIKTTDHRQMSIVSASKVLKSYKSTSLVLVYFIVILITSIAYIFILIFIRQYNLGVSELRISLEIVNILNCSLDPYLYVLWFRETRMELLKMISPFCKKHLSAKVESMRTEIFNIVVSDFSKCSSKVGPLPSPNWKRNL